MTRGLSEFERQLLQIAWELSGRTGEPHGTERKRLVRHIRALSTRGAKPLKPENAPGSGYQAGVQFMEVLEDIGRLRVLFRGPWPGGAPAPREPLDLSHLAKVPEKDRYARLPKPWKGRAGRAATRNAGTTTKTKTERQLRSKELHRQGLTYAEIAKREGCTVRTVQRDVTGH